ncbi:sensor histidine kinase [Pelagicoccus sp. SDUM812002]|uniref:sensor histidine kinase n=1 Tax=Pelagicoccus sp. SDUM812002 TaxID=3041266 RepID=UPI00280F92A5|nr:sensor histidine kinase [Pelagicoccus sp. SDUM812002]MDQ8187596.1 sensor histidine kinase [Pelagicoccus sp. SDUM812002]
MQENTIQKNSENLCHLADYLLQNRREVLSDWKERALGDAELEVMTSLSRREFFDHVPQVLDLFDEELRRYRDGMTDPERLARSNPFEKHGLSRWQQGFSMTELVRDWNHLRCAILRSITKAVSRDPEIIEPAFAKAADLLADLIAEGVNQSVAKFEEIRQAEARSHAIDLRNTVQDLREIYSRQTALYRDAGHDLVGHLGILSSITHVFQNRSEDESLSQLFGPLTQGLGQAVDILEDVKLQATLEAGQAKLHFETLDLVDLMRDTLAPYLILAREKSIDLEMSGCKKLRIETDSAKLTRILQNLLHNALKFTTKGSITVRWGSCSDKARFYVRIENHSSPTPTPASMPLGMQMVKASFANSTHVGTNGDASEPLEMNRPHRTRTLEHRADPLEASREGLGLSIAKRLANLLGGRLDVVGADGHHGARVTLTLPLEGLAPVSATNFH